MKQIVHETDKLAISTVKLRSAYDPLDAFLNINSQNLPYETIVFPMVNGQPDFGSPIEIKNYATQVEAEAGHQAMIEKYDAKI